MKEEVGSFIGRCDTCQRVKDEHQKPVGLLQPIKVPEWKWDEIGMDFITGLPRTKKGNDFIWVIVDRLTKVAHFLPVKTTYGGDCNILNLSSGIFFYNRGCPTYLIICAIKFLLDPIPCRNRFKSPFEFLVFRRVVVLVLSGVFPSGVGENPRIFFPLSYLFPFPSNSFSFLSLAGPALLFSSPSL